MNYIYLIAFNFTV